MRRTLKNILRILLVIIPFVWIFWKVDRAGLSQALELAAWWTIPAMVVTTLTVMFLQGFRWWLLLRAFIPDLPLSRTLSAHFSALFYSVALPTSAAQDVVRAALISRDQDLGVVWGSTWVAKILGLVVLVVLSLTGVALLDTTLLPAGSIWYYSLAVALIIALLALSFSKGITRHFRPWFARLLPTRIFTIVDQIRQGVFAYRNQKQRVFIVFLITVFILVALIGNATLLLRGISGRWFPQACFAFIPVIEMICIALPLTPNSIGIREALSTILFRYIGLSYEQLGIYVILTLIGAMLKLVGVVPVIYTWKTARTPTPKIP